MTSANNGLLRTLKPADYRLLSPHIEMVALTRGQVLFEPGEEVRTVHFPLDGTVISFVISMRDGATAQTVSIGREGVIGGVVSQGFVPAFARAVVEIPGAALRLDLTQLNAAKRRSEGLANLFARYADCLHAQTLQAVACNALHTIEQRAARWLLATQDRVGEDDVLLTQELLSEMLGVQRTYVTRVAKALQEAGVIRYQRGRITILDRTRLEKAACECHAAVRAHFDRVLAGVYPSEAEKPEVF
jgi:CRP-like cAMP-binding protein